MAKKIGEQPLYIPERGDIVWIDFDPSQGIEIRKTRPALIISPLSYNKKVGLALFCPITSHKKGYPFEVDINVPSGKDIAGTILADQIKNLDWKIRNARFAGKAPDSVVIEVLEKLSTLIMLS